MVVEQQILPFWQWLIRGTRDHWGALATFLSVAVTVGGIALLAGYLIAAVRHGPIKAGDQTYQVIMTGLRELFILSPGRVAALAWLAVKESMRRRSLVAMGVFVVILLFAGWFLGTEYPQPARLYLSFVLTATTYLVLLMALLLSAFSLPNDIRSRTIHTIVTKPVRAGELVLGRILGFTIVGTMLLTLMGVCSYFFVVRALRHSHSVDVPSLAEAVLGQSTAGKRGRTTADAHHRHEVFVDQEGNGRAEPNHGHWHEVTAHSSDGRVQYRLGPPLDYFQARIPVYGKLRFQDRTGADVPYGINVGNEWTYRSYIDGGSRAAAIWTFTGIDESQYAEGLPLELMVSVFRTHKGSIEEGILGSLVVRNPADRENKASDLITFRAKEFTINEFFIPRELTDAKGQPLDLIRDLVHDGSLEIWVQCLDPGQYYGVAQADCYLRSHDGRFAANFVKGYVSIWLQMILVISFAVGGSTFLSGPVAMLLTLSVIVVGLFKDFILGVAKGAIEGGGPIESLVRLVTQRNVTSELEEGLGTTLTQAADAVLTGFMRSLTYLLPDFRQLSTVRYVADGYDISYNLLAQDFMTSLAYVAGLFVMGYFFLRTREVAR